MFSRALSLSLAAVLSASATGAPAVTAALEHSAWSITGSFLVNGEEAGYGNVRPKNFFVPQSGKWGAVQLVARFNTLQLDAGSFPVFADAARSVREATAWGLGVNWIWNGNLKYVVDYEQTSFKGGAPGGADRADEKIVQSRLHLSF
jgi:phosphate-selective porin OprO and OprP